MSFILTIFCKLIYSLVAVARDILFKELFEQTLILCFTFFFLPGRLPEVPRARACSRCVSHYSHSTRKKGRITEAASMTLESTNRQTLSPSEFFAVRNFFITTSKRKALVSASRSPRFRGPGERNLETFHIWIDVSVNRLPHEIRNEIRRILFKERLDFLLSFSSRNNVCQVKRYLFLSREQGGHHSALCIRESISETNCRTSFFQNVLNSNIKNLFLFIY
nr:MAG TPA: hypothetical protein [Caudoviricetes sp.]